MQCRTKDSRADDEHAIGLRLPEDDPEFVSVFKGLMGRTNVPRTGNPQEDKGSIGMAEISLNEPSNNWRPPLLLDVGLTPHFHSYLTPRHSYFLRTKVVLSKIYVRFKTASVWLNSRVIC